MSRKLILKWLNKLKTGETVYQPHDWLAAGDDGWIKCPLDNTALEYLYDANPGLYEYSVYQCPHCKQEWTSTELFAVGDALKAFKGEDPYEGAIFVHTDEDGEQTFYTQKWQDED